MIDVRKYFEVSFRFSPWDCVPRSEVYISLISATGFSLLHSMLLLVLFVPQYWCPEYFLDDVAAYMVDFCTGPVNKSVSGIFQKFSILVHQTVRKTDVPGMGSRRVR